MPREHKSERPPEARRERAHKPLDLFEAADAGTLHARMSRGGDGARFRGAYVHVPFCFHKCHYCDFYSFVETRGREAVYVDRLLDEARAWSDLAVEPLETLFVGGGTPTLLEPRLLARLLDGVRRLLPWRGDAEWTVEANPETVTVEIARVLADSGVNRVSIGCQSFEPTLLKALERWHDPASVPRAVERLRAAGIDNLNLDLIFAIPGGTLVQWERDLERAFAMEPTHLSCYGLVYEPNTALTKRRDMGDVTQVDDGVEAAMYEFARERLAAEWFEHYEISNWARSGRRSRHNELYWTDADWLALGPSASGHADALRWKNVPRLGDWLERGPFSPLEYAEHVTSAQRRGERFMLGLRRLEGIPLDEVERLLAPEVGAERDAGHGAGTRAGAEPRTSAGTGTAAESETRRRAIGRACADGLLERAEGRLRLTPRGLLLADSVLATLI